MLSACAPMSLQNGLSVFDSAEFIKEQCVALQSKAFKLKKVADSGETLTLDKPNWAHELSMFSEANINKGLLKDRYTLKKDTDKAEYSALDEELKVRRISIVFEKGTETPKSLTIHFKEVSKLYEIERKMALDLKNNQLKGYQIEGIQKVFGLEPIKFRLEGTVIH